MSAAQITWDAPGPQVKWDDEKPMIPAPAGTPTVPKPTFPPMQQVRTLTGTPYNPGPLESSIVGLEKGAIQQAADVSAPTILHRVAQRIGIAGPGSRLYPGEAPLHEIPGKAVTAMAGAMGGEDVAPAEMAARPAARIPTPEAETSNPGMLGRAGEVAWRRAGHIPGVQGAKDVYYVLRGPKEVPKPITTSETKPPIPETNGIPWGTRGPGPLDMRGQRIPAPEPGSAGSMAESVTASTPIARPSAYPPDRGPLTSQGPLPGSREDIAETKGIQERSRELGQQEDVTQHRLAREDMGRIPTKGEMTGTAGGPVKLTKTPRARAIAPASKSVEKPAADDLTPEWQKELDRVKAKKGKPGS